MTFVFSKLFWMLAQPLQIIALFMALGLVLLLTRKKVLGRRLVVWAGLFLLIFAWLPVGRLVAIPLEQRFRLPTVLPEKVDGIIVLGGFVANEQSQIFGQPALTDGTERLLVGVTLARQFPQARLLNTGGTASILPTTARGEADIVRDVLVGLGFDEPRMLYENQSRNTWENAVFSKQLAQPQMGETWLLVTSAMHMPRAVGIFRQIGWPVVPYPVDYRASWGWSNFGEPLGELLLLQGAVREWIGLVVYRLMDRTASLFPGA